VKVGCCLLEAFSFSSSLLWIDEIDPPGSLQQVNTKIALENELYEKQQKIMQQYKKVYFRQTTNLIIFIDKE
jgi:hypothetical protein